MNRAARHLGLVLLVLVMPVLCSAQPASDFGLAEGMKQVEEGEFDNAIVTLDTAARRLAADPKRVRDLSQAYLYLGIAYVGKGHEAAAKAKFREALSGIKDLSLSAERFPPKVVDLFEAARAEARAETSPARSAASPAAPAKKGGGGKGLLVIGGLAVVGGGVALAAGGGGGGEGGGGSSPTTTTPGQSVNRSGTLGPGNDVIIVTPAAAGTLEATITWTDRNLKLDIACQEHAPPYTGCSGAYNRTSDTSGRYVTSVQQKQYDIVIYNYESATQTYTIVIRYP